MKVGDLARRVFLRISPEDSMLPILPIIQEHGFGKALVFEGVDFRGVVSKESFVDNRGLMLEKPLSELNVADFMDTNIPILKADDEVYEGVDKLLTTSSRVDTVPVKEEGIIGYVTSKEYTRLFSEKMEGKFKTKDLMHFSPATVYDYTPLEQVIKEITDSGSKHVIVLRGKTVVGVITVKDLMLTLFHHHSENKNPYELTAEEIMTSPPLTVEEEVDSAEAASIMDEKRVGGLPVLDKGELKGLLTRRDLLKGFEVMKQDGKLEI
jgi:CBS domain-containing protein